VFVAVPSLTVIEEDEAINMFMEVEVACTRSFTSTVPLVTFTLPVNVEVAFEVAVIYPTVGEVDDVIAAVLPEE
jgi:hypothetical protein